MDDLEEIRKRKMQSLQAQAENQQYEVQARQQMEHQKEGVLRQALTIEAKSRLTNLKLANSQLSTQVEQLVIYAYSQSGQKIDDKQLRGLLEKIRGTKKETRITRK